MSTERRIRSRRTHHKSRLGCENCKRRRVKCDEIKPTCTNCQNHSVECDYSTTSSPPVIPSSSQAYRFKQSKYQVSSPFSSSSSSSPNQPHPSPPPNPIITPDIHTHADCISLADLQLFHHYLTSTAPTLTENHDPKHLWTTHVPQWSFTSPYLLHLMLALSALHLAHQQPNLSAAYRTQADAHFAAGVRGVTAVLTSLDAQNCQPLYIAAVLVCFVYFGHGPREGEFLVFGVGGRAEWLVLMHGVRSILESRRGQIFTEALKPEVEDEEVDMGEELEGELRRHGEMIREVKRLIGLDAVDDEVRKMYDSMLDRLEESFGEVFRMRSTGRHGVGLMHLIIGWIYRLPKEFVALLEGKDSLALVILAYWSILLKYMQSSWMMNGWDEHVLSGIEESLREDRRGWIQWPVECIRGISGIQ